MKVKNLKQVRSWTDVLNAARRTIGKEPLEKEPSDSWKAKMLLAEHSPIRLLEYDWTWEDIKQWVSVHLVRHHIGVEKFKATERSDRNEKVGNRDEYPQGALSNMDMTANAQAIMNISRKRLCKCASKETREAWKAVIDELKKIDPILADKCAPECIYRGFCPEFIKSCGYDKTEKYKEDTEKYRKTNY